MASLSYDQIYSRFFSKVKAYDFLYEGMDDRLISELMCSWLHGSVHYPMIRKLFDTVTMDDDEQTITYTMNYSVDDESDAEFLIDILSDNMIVKWLEPKVKNLSTIYQNFGTSEQKFFSQASHLQQLMALEESLQNRVRSQIADRGGEWNIYLDGTSATSTLRTSE